MSPLDIRARRRILLGAIAGRFAKARRSDITINAASEISYTRADNIGGSARAPYSLLSPAMDAENMQLYEATPASTARDEIYESLRFLKN